MKSTIRWASKVDRPAEGRSVEGSRRLGEPRMGGVVTRHSADGRWNWKTRFCDPNYWRVDREQADR